MNANIHLRQLSDITERGEYEGLYRLYGVMPHRHCCLLAGSLIDTPAGLQPIDCLRPGDHVWGHAHDQKILAQVLRVHRGDQAPEGIQGFALRDTAVVAGLTSLCWQGRWVVAAEVLEPAAFDGPVYDLETDTGNFYCRGVLSGHFEPDDLPANPGPYGGI